MIVQLKSYHRKAKSFKHPLLDWAKPISREKASELTQAYFADRSGNRDALITGLFSALRNLVGRYLHNWPATRPYLEDMVGEGLLSIIKTVDTLTSDVLGERNILQVAPMRMQKAIETMLYEMSTIVAPSKRTQETLSAAGQEVPAAIVESDLTGIDREDVSDQQQRDLREAEEALDVMAARLQLDADLLKADYRYLTAEEAAARLGVHFSTIQRRRAKLRQIYNIEFGGEQ